LGGSLESEEYFRLKRAIVALDNLATTIEYLTVSSREVLGWFVSLSRGQQLLVRMPSQLLAVIAQIRGM